MLLWAFPFTSYVSADNSSSSCANIVVNGAANTCYTLTPPEVAPGIIVIDGQGTEPEWSSAVSKNLIGDMPGTVRVLREGDTLFILIEVEDPLFNASDRVRIFFDPLHNHSTSTDVVEFRIVRDSGPSPNHQKVTGGSIAVWTPLPGSAVATSPITTPWIVELSIEAAEFGVSDLPKIMGFGVQAEDSTGDLTVWPDNFNEDQPGTTWANLKTRYPIDYMIVLDQSGSMLSQNKWDDAKLAANFMVNTMAILGNPDYFEDRLGLVTFAFTCSGGNRSQTITARPLAAVQPFPVGNWVDGSSTPVPPPLPNNCTPIGHGLHEAFIPANLDATVLTSSKERQRMVLLLSDGLQNRPSSTFSPTDTGYEPCPTPTPFSSPCPDSYTSNIQVNTVAFGQGDWQVDTQLLANIRTRYVGTFATTYNLSTNIEDLKQNFIEALQDSYRMNLIHSGPLANFVVNPGEHRLVAILSWSNPGQAQDVALELLQGSTWVNQDCEISETDTAVGFAICGVDDPQAGDWRVVPDNGVSFSPVPDRQFILVDLNLRARYAIDQAVHGTGVDIILTVELKEGGQSILHDPATHPVTVTVNIQQPTEGFGTFVSTHDIETCRKVEPSLPPIDPKRIAEPGLMFGLASTIPATAVGADPAAAHFQLMNNLLERCEKDGLSREKDPGIALRDDGTQGDLVANDGIYSLRFTNTEYEGTYIFHFNVEGMTASGAPFSRTGRFADYVRVEVDPASSPTGSRILHRDGSRFVMEYHILPRDRFGGYLGPGHADQVQFLSNGGKWIRPVVDYGNGYYAGILQYDRATEGKPNVVSIVQGKSISHETLFCLPQWILYLLVLIIVILFVLLLICWLRKLRPIV
jgi:hypothetical protein